MLLRWIRTLGEKVSIFSVVEGDEGFPPPACTGESEGLMGIMGAVGLEEAMSCPMKGGSRIIHVA